MVLLLIEKDESDVEHTKVNEDLAIKYETPDQLEHFLITLSMTSESRWKCLSCIDLIKVQLFFIYLKVSLLSVGNPRCNVGELFQFEVMIIIIIKL